MFSGDGNGALLGVVGILDDVEGVHSGVERGLMADFDWSFVSVEVEWAVVGIERGQYDGIEWGHFGDERAKAAGGG